MKNLRETVPLSGAQVNNSRCPVFTGKYVEYHRFRKEWWAHRRTYYGHVMDGLVSRALKEKCLSGSMRSMVNNIEDLQEAWDTLETCFDRQEKYITEVLDPIIKFRKYRAFDNGAVREFLLSAKVNHAGGQESRTPPSPHQ